jgi:hypothetical protein
MHNVVILRRTADRVRTAGLAGAIVLAGCGKSDDSNAMTQAWNPDESSGGSSGGSADSHDASSPSDPAGDEAPQSCDAPCDAPPTDCQLAPGACDHGSCSYDNALAGTPCITDCVGGGYCDADGQCICSESCADTCVGADHMTAACDDAGACQRACEAPYEDCDGDPANGCEIPVGMPHQCDATGINVDGGCWTAYCGASSGDGVFDFGTYHCVDCSTCAVPSAGQCHWCDHASGNWFPQEVCECGEYLDVACGPA